MNDMTRWLPKRQGLVVALVVLGLVPVFAVALAALVALAWHGSPLSGAWSLAISAAGAAGLVFLAAGATIHCVAPGRMDAGES